MVHLVSQNSEKSYNPSLTAEGTGKTSVIAAMTECILVGGEEEPSDDIPRPPSPDDSEAEQELNGGPSGPVVWIVAQSNVAVKNVAEKLQKVGIHQFKLIVSQEFYFEWQVSINAWIG
jgi:regulator of nonsense transcripts 1